MSACCIATAGFSPYSSAVRAAIRLGSHGPHALRRASCRPGCEPMRSRTLSLRPARNCKPRFSRIRMALNAGSVLRRTRVWPAQLQHRTRAARCQTLCPMRLPMWICSIPLGLVRSGVYFDTRGAADSVHCDGRLERAAADICTVRLAMSAGVASACRQVGRPVLHFIWGRLS